MHLVSNTQSRFSSAPNDPSTFASTFDLLHELATNHDQHSSDETQATVYKFPGSLLMQIDRTCAQVPLSHSNAKRPGRNTCMCACISHGISLLSADENVKFVLRLRNELDIMIPKDDDSSFSQMIWNIFDDFPISNSVSYTSNTRRQGLYLSKDLKKKISSTKQRLGLNLDSIVILCIQLCLYDQEWIAKDVQKQMRDGIENFYRATRIRKIMFEALLAELKRQQEEV